MRTLIVILVAAGIMAGCSDSFDPTASGGQPIVIFALMNANVDTQYVRVHQSSPPTVPVPPNDSVAGAVVKISGASIGTITATPVLQAPAPGSPDTSMIRVYRLPFRPSRGQAYAIDVASPSGSASAAIVIPGTADLSTNDFLILQSPYTYPADRVLAFSSLLANQTLGFVIRLALEYDAFENGVWTRHVQDVPLNYTTYPPSLDAVNQATLTRRLSTPTTSTRGVVARDAMIYNNTAYRQTIKLIIDKYLMANVRWSRVLILLVQTDAPFFRYFSYANNFQDRLTIRVDQPDFSNFTGALGFFGSMSIDTVSYALPATITPK